LYGVVSFAGFLLLTFPAELVLQRVVASLEQSAAVRVRYRTGEWSWSQGWTLRDLTIEKTGVLPPVRLSRATLSPSLFGLLRARSFPLTFSANLYGGTGHGTIERKGTTVSIQFGVDQMALDQWPFPAPGGQGKIAGTLTAEGTVQGEPADVSPLSSFSSLSSWAGNLTATITNGSLKAGTIAKFPLPTLHNIQARAQATIQQGRVEVSGLTVEADGVEASLQGFIALRLPLEWSTLDLQLTTRQTGNPPPALATLLAFLPAVPGAQGERRATITGTLAAPVMK
jgi:type II secretion system protein N